MTGSAPRIWVSRRKGGSGMGVAPRTAGDGGLQVVGCGWRPLEALAVVGRETASGQLSPEVWAEGVEPEVFDRLPAESGAIHATTALGLADLGPVGRAVAGAAKAVGLHERLHERARRQR